MTYEQAKQLKDAGFTQDEVFRWSGWLFPGDTIKDKGARVPTLSELIEACGDELLNLEHVLDGGIDGTEKLWWASSKNHSRAGLTPEEAVANLWLALNKK